LLSLADFMVEHVTFLASRSRMPQT